MRYFSKAMMVASAALCLNLSAYAQDISLKINNVTVKEAIELLKKNTGYSFVFSSSDLNTKQRVSVSAENATIEEVVTQILKGQKGLDYEIQGKKIVVRKAASVAGNQNSQKIVKISGNVVDSNGIPVIGATIKEQNGIHGTITDFDGNFSLDLPENSKFSVSYIGYLSQTITCKDGKSYDIVLKEDTETLDEVVVVGYGTTTKRAMISSVASVKSENMEKLPVSNVAQGMAGMAAGLLVKDAGGGVNKQPTISIRGGGTPLVVIDGIIRNYSDFVLLSPEDIESLSILKDASATAVYGSRAADGIIQVTTKKGKEGKPQIEYNFNYSLAQPTNWARPMNSWERAEYANIAKRNDGLEDAYSPEAIQKMKDGSDPISYNNTSYRDIVLRDFAPQSKHSIKMSGGTDINNYYVSLGHIDQGSLYFNNSYNMQRTNFRLSQNSLIKSIGLKLTSTLDGYLQETTHPYSSATQSPTQIFAFIQNTTPLLPAVNKYGLPYNSGANNPYAEVMSNGYKRNNSKAINGNLVLEWSLPWVEGLKLKASGNYRYGFDNNKDWRQDPDKYDYESKEPVQSNKPMLRNETSYGYTYTLQFFAEYSKSIKKHNMSILAGYEATYGRGYNYWLSRENYDFPIDQIQAGPESTQKNGGSENEYGRAGYVAQVKYNYDNKYFIEGSLRYDGSDNFPTNRRWGTFYSGSLGWSILDEDFMSFFREKNIFNQLKIRTSYGQVGLDNWGSPFSIGRFAYLSSYNLNNKAWVVNGAYVPGFSEGDIPSPDITWFTTDQFDLGFDFSSLDNRLYGSLDYFFYKTKGFLYTPDPKDVGYTAPLGKSLPRISTDGEHRRAGFDFTLGWRNTHGDFSYNVSMNFTKFDQLWAYDPSEQIANVMNPYKRSSQQVGYYGNMYECLGFYNGTEDVYNSVKRLGSYNLTSGDLKYKDFNGDGKIDSEDQIRLGKNSFPRGNFGINVGLEYKGFFFSTLFQGATKFDMYISGSAQMSSGAVGDLPVIYDYQTDFWRNDNTDARYPRLMSSQGLNGNNNIVSSDFWLLNGAYVRMKNIQIGYDFKKILAKDIAWLSKAVVSLSGQNIFTISETTKFGLDPENSSVENFGYPNERIFAINVNLGF